MGFRTFHFRNNHKNIKLLLKINLDIQDYMITMFRIDSIVKNMNKNMLTAFMSTLIDTELMCKLFYLRFSFSIYRYDRNAKTSAYTFQFYLLFFIDDASDAFHKFGIGI